MSIALTKIIFAAFSAFFKLKLDNVYHLIIFLTTFMYLNTTDCLIRFLVLSTTNNLCSLFSVQILVCKDAAIQFLMFRRVKK